MRWESPRYGSWRCDSWRGPLATEKINRIQTYDEKYSITARLRADHCRRETSSRSGCRRAAVRGLQGQSCLFITLAKLAGLRAHFGIVEQGMQARSAFSTDAAI